MSKIILARSDDRTPIQKFDADLGGLFDNICKKVETLQLRHDLDIEDPAFRESLKNWLGPDFIDGYEDWREETFG